MVKILISACLLGEPVRYDAKGKQVVDERIDRWSNEGKLVPLCPEIAAGFPIPRPPAEIVNGCDGSDVLDGTGHILEDIGRDVTQGFISGAEIALEVAKSNGCTLALLTDGSPSCGSTYVYSGAFDGQRRDGKGVVAELLSRNGIKVFPESQIEELAAMIELQQES